MPKKTPQKHNPQDIFLHAERFRHALLVIQTGGGTGTLFPAAIVPAMVLSAFGSELYLKCLLSIETGSAPEGHNLKWLFDRLKLSTRSRIEELWPQFNPHQERFAAHIRSEFGVEEDKSFISLLTKGSLGFQRLRYAYEGIQDFRFDLTELPHVLHQTIIEIQPDWAQFVPRSHTLPTSHSR